MNSSVLALRDIIADLSYRQGDILLSSGIKSSHYFDLKPTMLNAFGAKLCSEVITPLFRDIPEIDYIAGIEMGSVPLLSMLIAQSIHSNPFHAIFLRKQAKQYGSQRLIEGVSEEELRNKHVVLIDDVSTSGASFIRSLNILRDCNAVVKHAISIIDREEGARELLSQRGVELHSVLSVSDFLRQ